MYDLYTTKGFIVMARYTGEDSRIYHILTEDLGLITARAQGVRKIASKLRYHLQLFRELGVTLVRGRDFWRITGAETTAQSKLEPAQQVVWSRLGLFMRGQLLYQQPDRELFHIISRVYEQLAKVPTHQIAEFEQVARAHMLRHLGYWNEASIPDLEDMSSGYKLSPVALRVLQQAEVAAGT